MFGYVRDREDAIRRDTRDELAKAEERLHGRIRNRRDELERFRREEFGTVGEQIGQLVHDLSRGAQPGWVAMRLEALEQSIGEERAARSSALEDARNGAREYVDTKVGELRREVETLTAATKAQAETLTWFQRAVFGAMFVALTSLAVQVLLLTKGS